MKKRRIVSCLVIFASVLLLVACKSNGTKEKIIVGTEAGFAPYEYMRGNEVVGIDMDIANAIADELGKELVIKNMDFDGALTAVSSGKVDFVAAGVSVTDERKETMDFSHEYVDSTEVVLVNGDVPAIVVGEEGITGEDLDGKVVAVQQGNIADIWVSSKDNCNAKEVRRYTKLAQAAEDLKNEKIDCIVMDCYPAEEMVAANPGLKILDGVLFEDKYAIAVKKGNQELLDDINAVIDKLIADGKIAEFTASHTTEGQAAQQQKEKSFMERMYDAVIRSQRYFAYLDGLKVTILISLLAILLGTLIGLLVAVVKVSPSANIIMVLLQKICGIYTTVIRGTPVMVQLLIMYNLIFTSRDTNEILVGSICFGINSGAYVAEIIRAGIESVDKGQMEAGRSLGFNYIQAMRFIIVPQAIKNILPALGNEFIVLIKETSVAGVIAVTDLTKAAQYIGSASYDVLPPLYVAAACYLVIVLGLTKLQGMLERRMAQGDHR